MFVEDNDVQHLLALVGILNSRAFGILVSLQLARTELAQSFEVGLIQRTPVPHLASTEQAVLAALARRAWSLRCCSDTSSDTSHAFVLPALLQVGGDRLSIRVSAWTERSNALETEVALIQAEIDERCFHLYGIGDTDRNAMTYEAIPDPGSSNEIDEGKTRREVDGEAEEQDDLKDSSDPSVVISDLMAWVVGVAFGRFDVRLATGARIFPLEPEPFDPLPICAPGMLTRDDRLPCDRAPPELPNRLSGAWHSGR